MDDQAFSYDNPIILYFTTPRLLEQEELWLKDSQGYPVLQGPWFLTSQPVRQTKVVLM